MERYDQNSVEYSIMKGKLILPAQLCFPVLSLYVHLFQSHKNIFLNRKRRADWREKKTKTKTPDKNPGITKPKHYKAQALQNSSFPFVKTVTDRLDFRKTANKVCGSKRSTRKAQSSRKLDTFYTHYVMCRADRPNHPSI